ncbi:MULTISPECIES: ABC transporter permease subunit [unclassified Paenibacillus]|uniref:ABC transporter permease n=1 Tax=unclassified Paenibacillus TaxID=185978 RepID=UPI001AE4896B|nr:MULTISPECIES: ABC transporter permease subunit [unclassified Paenibacillus]MBP1154458.1 NitT/TauT family transport system permease protein [Paenibacillus sp. PvP091]MBP1170158.1 NitT/TauT family transport system permease protein [Paenibacillus sp. PvR098]MBP2441186.1 NitT/TauT family transport system permease protein [Paenibacillus sp. PvP052]
MLKIITNNRYIGFTAFIPLIILWEILGQMELTFMLPPLTDVLKAGLSVWSNERFLSSIQNSLLSLVYGFGLAVVIGLVVGVLMGRYKTAEYMLDIYVNTLMAAPMAALVPILVLIFGLGSQSIVSVVFLYSVFVIIVQTSSGVRHASKALGEMAYSFGANEGQILQKVVLPAALPMIMNGLQLGIGRAVKGLIIGEQLVALVGIGAIIMRYGAAFQVAELYAMILFIGLLGLLLMQGVGFLQRLLIKPSHG